MGPRVEVVEIMTSCSLVGKGLPTEAEEVELVFLPAGLEKMSWSRPILPPFPPPSISPLGVESRSMPPVPASLSEMPLLDHLEPGDRLWPVNRSR